MNIEEAMMRTEHYCKAYSIDIPSGYEVVDFSGFVAPKTAALYPYGDISREGVGYIAYHAPIIRRKVKRVTPTDGDARRRPQVFVTYEGKETECVLYVVDERTESFLVRYDGGIFRWESNCRMKE